MSKHLPLWAAFVAELLLWLLPAAIFIAAYILYFNGPESAIEPHLKLIGSMGLAWLGLRLAIEHRESARVTRTAFQILYSFGLVFLLLYYAVILIGLSSWGRVPTWRLITVYFHQWRELLAVLDAPVFLAPLGLCFLFALVYVLVQQAHSRLQWPRQFAAFARKRMCLILAVAGLVPFAVLAFETYDAVDHLSGEPIMLSLNAGLGVEIIQNNQSEGARLLDKRESEAAAAYRPGVLATPRNVILIVGDALRSDNLSLFQYSRPTTPYLDSLREAGQFALVQRIQSVCAESYCGLMAIARSKFVHEFSRASLTLQKVLLRHGYDIALILGGDHTNFYGLAEALGPTDLYWDGLMSEGYVNDDQAVIDRVAELPDWNSKPIFLQLHLMSTHGLGQRQESFMQFMPARNYYRRWKGASDESRSAVATNFYDNGVLQFDWTVKELLETLLRKGYLENALVIVTGDHGEMLGEHGHFAHADKVFRPVLDVPLLMLRYGYEGLEIQGREFASQVDVAPTVLHELGLPVPESWSGTALQNSTSRQFLFFQQSREVGLLDLRDDDKVWKFWIDMATETPFAFDAQLDPMEMQNLIGEVPARLRSEWMLQLLPAGVMIGEQTIGDSLGADLRK